MEYKESENLQRELEHLAEEWDKAKYEYAQPTHVFADPAAKEFGKRPEAIPFMLKRLSSDITWVVPIEKALSYIDVDLTNKIDIKAEAKRTGNSLQDRLAHLEGNRQAIQKWAKEKGLDF